jgi:hypothetical protein
LSRLTQQVLWDFPRDASIAVPACSPALEPVAVGLSVSGALLLR